MATITGQRGRSTLPLADTPDRQAKQSGAPGGLSRAGAEAAWSVVTAAIAGTPHVRISKDGGRTYPARHARALPAGPPDQPCTVAVYGPGSGTGRMLALDLDPGRTGRDVHGGAGRQDHEHCFDPAVQVRVQAEALAALVARCGGQVLADVSPSGGRHVLIPFSAPLPWRELRDVARGLSLRFPAVDPAPMCSLGGQISPPGSRHKSGGWRVLSTPLDEARAAVEHPNGPEVWAALLDELTAELQALETGTVVPDPEIATELDGTGAPWLPRLGGRGALER